VLAGAEAPGFDDALGPKTISKMIVITARSPSPTIKRRRQ
jgi:hypothetical protein